MIRGIMLFNQYLEIISYLDLPVHIRIDSKFLKVYALN